MLTDPVVHRRASRMDHLHRVRFPTLVINGRAYIGYDCAVEPINSIGMAVQLLNLYTCN